MLFLMIRAVVVEDFLDLLEYRQAFLPLAARLGAAQRTTALEMTTFGRERMLVLWC